MTSASIGSVRSARVPTFNGRESDQSLAERIATAGCVLAVRRGEVPLTELLDRLHAETAPLERAVLGAAVTDEPDQRAIDRFLVDVYRRAWQ